MCEERLERDIDKKKYNIYNNNNKLPLTREKCKYEMFVKDTFFCYTNVK